MNFSVSKKCCSFIASMQCQHLGGEKGGKLRPSFYPSRILASRILLWPSDVLLSLFVVYVRLQGSFGAVTTQYGLLLTEEVLLRRVAAGLKVLQQKLLSRLPPAHSAGLPTDKSSERRRERAPQFHLQIDYNGFEASITACTRPMPGWDARAPRKARGLSPDGAI